MYNRMDANEQIVYQAIKTSGMAIRKDSSFQIAKFPPESVHVLKVGGESNYYIVIVHYILKMFVY